MAEKCDQLFDDPEDVRELLKVLAALLEIDPDQAEKHEKLLSKVDKILLKQLKAGRISPSEYGVVHLYLNRIGGTQETFDYSLMRMH